jgi:hypothetical protein
LTGSGKYQTGGNKNQVGIKKKKDEKFLALPPDRGE